MAGQLVLDPYRDFAAWLTARGMNPRMARIMESELGIGDYSALLACARPPQVRYELLTVAKERLPFAFYAVLRQILEGFPLKGIPSNGNGGSTNHFCDCQNAVPPHATFSSLLDAIVSTLNGLSQELFHSAQRFTCLYSGTTEVEEDNAETSIPLSYGPELTDRSLGDSLEPARNNEDGHVEANVDGGGEGHWNEKEALWQDATDDANRDMWREVKVEGEVISSEGQSTNWPVKTSLGMKNETERDEESLEWGRRAHSEALEYSPNTRNDAETRPTVLPSDTVQFPTYAGERSRQQFRADNQSNGVRGMILCNSGGSSSLNERDSFDGSNAVWPGTLNGCLTGQKDGPSGATGATCTATYGDEQVRDSWKRATEQTSTNKAGGRTRMSSRSRNTLGKGHRKLYCCEQCGQEFAQKYYLLRHRRKHTGERPFACAVCGKCFGQSCDLSRHTRIHTEERPYECAACGKMFKLKHHLRDHQQTHIRRLAQSIAECSSRNAS
uniref:uncharacterized protein isoform X2 n=1 Tax=Myxine glutinosa TaxID=7769 RepID=UPI00358F4DFB